MRHEIVKVDFASAMPTAAKGDDAAGRRFFEEIEELSGEGKMAKVIDSKSLLKALGAFMAAEAVEASVVQEHVQLSVLLVDFGSESADGIEVGEIEVNEVEGSVGGFGKDEVAGHFGLGHVAAGHNDMSALASQNAGGGEAKAGVGTSDEDVLALLRGNVVD